MTIQVALFDLGGVVCRFRPDRRLAALARASGLTEGEVHARIWGSGLDERCDRGEYDAAGAHRAIGEALSLALDRRALQVLWTLAFEPDPAVLSIVDGVREAVPTGLLTDNGPLLLESMPGLLPEVARRFDWLFFSCALGARKPSAELFGQVVARTGCPPGALLLIDDSAPNVAGAIACGLQACLYTEPRALARELGARGLPVTA